jgi:hypothetical protein
MQRIIEVWGTMPRSEKLNAIFMPPAFLILFWGFWVITPA